MLVKLSSKEQQRLKRDLKQFYEQKAITTCELHLPGCASNWALAFAHRSKRLAYVNRPETLWTFKETVLACTNCHQLIEGHAELTRAFFRELRP